MLFAGREVRIGKNCARAVLKNKGTAQMLEKKKKVFIPIHEVLQTFKEALPRALR